MPLPIINPIHAALRQAIINVVATTEDFGIDYDAPIGDAGLFGPDSATWKVHADFPGMMAGGIAALMLQTLHPRALAGVWDHSRFREDPLGRLRRTTMFVAATSYAPRADAERIIDRVDRMHARVQGHTPDGEFYSARDPELLTWVHCTEMYSFLNGYLRYRRADVPRAKQDRYFDETARIAEALGARNVPRSATQMTQYFEGLQPELRFDERSRDTLAVLERMPLPVPLSAVARRMFLGSGAALLPAWARTFMHRSATQQATDRIAAGALNAIAPVIRASMREGVAFRSARRVGADEDSLVFD
ncbi:MAG: hypothetical protein CMN28_06365 [Salinisphaeraceae bacterium]|nr:hypothetical protein [Salinisphaeraceae bacterium]